MKELPRAVRLLRPSLRVIDFANNLRLVEEDGFRDRSFVGMARKMELPTRMGVHFHTREDRRRWSAQSIPWIDFVADAERGAV